MRRALGCALVVSFLVAGAVSAHTPTPGSASWAGGVGGAPSYFKWASTVPTWLMAPMEDMLEVGWADASNNSNSIRFQRTTTGSATVHFSTRYEAGVPSDCYDVNWRGCSNGGGGLYWNIWIRNGYYVWCQNNPNGDPCRDAARTGIHEAGHVGGSLNHYDSSQTNTVMQTDDVPFQPDPGWNTHKLLKCDVARMQISYDVDTLSGPYADCFDHVANACSGGMCTDLTAPADTYVCSGIPFTISGRLDISSLHYGRHLSSGGYHLDGNSLAGRTVTIKRNGASYTTATATTASGNNWSKSITLTTGGSPITYGFSGQFIRPGTPGAMETGLASSAALTWDITVVPASLC